MRRGPNPVWLVLNPGILPLPMPCPGWRGGFLPCHCVPDRRDPSQEAPASTPHRQSLCCGESFLSLDQQATSCITGHSHNSVTLFLLFLHKRSFRFPLRFGLWNRSEKMRLFFLGPITCSLSTQSKAWGWHEGAMATGSWTSSGTDVIQPRLQLGAASEHHKFLWSVTLRRSFEECWPRA